MNHLTASDSLRFLLSPEELRPGNTRSDATLEPRGRSLAGDDRLAHATGSLIPLPDLKEVSGAALMFALQGAGVVEPHGRLLAEDQLDPSAALWRQRVLARLLAVVEKGGYSLVGGVLGRGPEGKRRVVLVLLRSHLQLAPVPRRPPQDASILLRGVLGPGYVAASAVVTAPDGSSNSPRLVSATCGSFHGVVPFAAGRGVYQVEILGTGPGGPEVLANVPLHVGVSVPDRRVLAPRQPPGSTDPQAAARKIWALLAEARRKAGRSPLAWHPVLARVARAHALSMCRRQEVLHHSEESGSAADRVAAAGLRVSWVGENVARAATPEEAHAELLQSPGHRALRLGAKATHGAVGVCVVSGPSGPSGPSGHTKVDHYVTEVFVQLPHSHKELEK